MIHALVRLDPPESGLPEDSGHLFGAEKMIAAHGAVAAVLGVEFLPSVHMQNIGRPARLQNAEEFARGSRLVADMREGGKSDNDIHKGIGKRDFLSPREQGPAVRMAPGCSGNHFRGKVEHGEPPRLPDTPAQKGLENTESASHVQDGHALLQINTADNGFCSGQHFRRIIMILPALRVVVKKFPAQQIRFRHFHFIASVPRGRMNRPHGTLALGKAPRT